MEALSLPAPRHIRTFRPIDKSRRPAARSRAMERVHASTVAMGGLAVLIRGPSGAGKSDLALRLIDAGARLIADDYTQVRRDGDRLIASAPPALAGRIEVRGLGILPMDCLEEAPIGLCLDLVSRETIERMPEPEYVTLLGISVPRLGLDGFAASTPAKLRLAMARLARGESLWPDWTRS